MRVSRQDYLHLLDRHKDQSPKPKKLRPAGNPESKIVKSIIEMLILNGIKAGKTKTMGVLRGDTFCYDKFLFRGFPDITGFASPVGIFFVEVKTSEKEKLRPAQESFRQDCLRFGVPYIVAWSWRVVEVKLKELGIL